jgi:hypothetical protein
MQDYVFVRGFEIYDAAIEGAKRGYNRSVNDCEILSKILKNEYELMIKNCTNDPKKRRQIRRNTKNNWRLAVIPLQFLMIHKQIKSAPSEDHVRVMLSETNSIFDIPVKSWEKLVALSH